MSSKRKKLYVVLGLFLTCLVVFFIVVAVSISRYNDNLLKNGIRVSAQVLDLSQLKTRKGKIKKSFVDLALFEEGQKIVPEKSEKPNGNSIDDKLDALFEEHGSKNRPMGEYESVQITTSSQNYNVLYIGKTVVFVYLAGEIKDGKLLIDLE